MGSYLNGNFQSTRRTHIEYFIHPTRAFRLCYFNSKVNIGFSKVNIYLENSILAFQVLSIAYTHCIYTLASSTRVRVENSFHNSDFAFLSTFIKAKLNTQQTEKIRRTAEKKVCGTITWMYRNVVLVVMHKSGKPEIRWNVAVSSMVL